MDLALMDLALMDLALMDFRSNRQFESPAVRMEMWQRRTRPLLTANWEAVSLFTSSSAATRADRCSLVLTLLCSYYHNFPQPRHLEEKYRRGQG